MDTIFKSATTKTDNGWMQCSFGRSVDDNSYVLTTHFLKADEVPEVMWDARSASQFVAGLLNAYFNLIDTRGMDAAAICKLGKPD